ncbi:MAG TPA: ADP-ribosylation factor-like protein [Mycobacteriales bacterium]|nr:ADP-ribosylation factor-like protein [Mycobacteriales bacterium]
MNDFASALPAGLGGLPALESIDISGNPLPPELLAAAKESNEELLRFLRLIFAEGRGLCEAKLVLVGEGNVGKSSLLGAMRGEDWVERRSTHGIEVKPVNVVHDGEVITLNGWDFGGQEIYRPTSSSLPTPPSTSWSGIRGKDRSWVRSSSGSR